MTTVVFFHAHPDDEALLTGGTMAGLARRGHRVVLVTATAGEAGLSARDLGDLGDRRRVELAAAAETLGCARVELLGYPDAGSERPVPPQRFATMPVQQLACRLAGILDDERAEVLVGYDPAGGYGHPDHVQVHHVARAAARMAGTPRLLEATVEREALQRALRVAAPFTGRAPDFRAARFADRYTAAERITHQVRVGDMIEFKRAAMRAHASQGTGGGVTRSLQRFLALPMPLFRAVFGREWYVEPGLQELPVARGDDILVAAAAVRPLGGGGDPDRT